jgi:hypothetical protein
MKFEVYTDENGRTLTRTYAGSTFEQVKHLEALMAEAESRHLTHMRSCTKNHVSGYDGLSECATENELYAAHWAARAAWLAA